MPIWKYYYIMNYDILNSGKVVYIIISYLSETEEKELDNIGRVVLKRGNEQFKISIRDVYCYGEIDFSTNSQDFKQLDDFDLCSIKLMHGQDIWSDYSYAQHKCFSPTNRVRWTETWSSAIYAQQCHGMIGKPERTIIFKYTK